MIETLRWFGSLALLWTAAVLHQTLSNRLSLFGIAPDFLLVVAGPVCLLARPAKATTFGFLAGLVQGALAGANMAAYVLSRTISATLLSFVARSGLQVGVVLAGLLCAGFSLAAQALLLFLAPPRDILSFIGATIASAVYNGVLSMPVYAILRRFAQSQTA